MSRHCLQPFGQICSYLVQLKELYSEACGSQWSVSMKCIDKTKILKKEFSLQTQPRPIKCMIIQYNWSSMCVFEPVQNILLQQLNSLCWHVLAILREYLGKHKWKSDCLYLCYYYIHFILWVLNSELTLHQIKKPSSCLKVLETKTTMHVVHCTLFCQCIETVESYLGPQFGDSVFFLELKTTNHISKRQIC